MGSSGTGTGDAVELLRGQGMRMTPQRLAIVDEIMSTAGYIIPTTVIDRVQARVPGVSPSTVYRTLERLEQVGVLTHVHLEQGTGYHRLEEVQDVHLTCSRCGTDLEFPRSSLRGLQGRPEARPRGRRGALGRDTAPRGAAGSGGAGGGAPRPAGPTRCRAGSARRWRS